MTDEVGLLQQAKYSLPDYEHGYCTDDNARALLAMVFAHYLISDPHWALGVIAGLSEVEDCTTLSTQLFYDALPILDQLGEEKQPRSLASALLGINAYLTRFSGDTKVRRYRGWIVSLIAEMIREGIRPGWV
ncbi:MAG: hypothetical protein SNJ78_04695 [Spirochaetales bacterium]